MQTIFTPDGIQLADDSMRPFRRMNATITKSQFPDGTSGYPTPDRCPVCGEPLTVVSMEYELKGNGVIILFDCNDGCGERSMSLPLECDPLSPFTTDDEVLRLESLNKLKTTVRELLDDFNKEAERAGYPDTDGRTIEFVPAEGNFMLCYVPEVRLGPLGMIISTARFDEDGNLALTFSEGELELEYAAAALDSTMLDYLNAKIGTARAEMRSQHPKTQEV